MNKSKYRKLFIFSNPLEDQLLSNYLKLLKILITYDIPYEINIDSRVMTELSTILI